MTSENLGLDLSHSQTKNDDSLTFNDSDDILNTLWSGDLSTTGSSTVGTWDELERDFGYTNDDAFIQSLQLNDVLRNNTPQQLPVDSSEQSDQFTRQVEQQIQREVLQHQETMQKQIREFQEQQQRVQIPRQASANDVVQFPSYDDYSQIRNIENGNEEEEQLKMFAQQRGMNLASTRKRKSEDMTESFNSLSVKTDNSENEFVITSAPNSSRSSGIKRRSSLANVNITSSNSSNTPISSTSSRSGSISGELDVMYAKGQLLDMACGEKEMLSYCTKATNFICSYTKVRIGGFYVNQRSSIEDWLLYYAFPSPPIFTTFFHFNVGFNLLLQASVEKRCFCVHSTAINSGPLSFMFVPIPVEDVNNALAVLVLGTILNTDDEMHNQLLFLDQVRKTVSSSMAAILSLQQNNALGKKLEVLKLENEVLKQKNRFERALIGVMASVGGYLSGTEGGDVAIICSDTMGTISYFSTSAQNLLGYNSSEIVGRYSPLKFHDPSEIQERARELEMEYGKKITPGFQVITEKTLRNGGMEETRDWTYIRKDGSSIRANVTIKPLYDEEDSSIIGFLSIAKQVQ